MSPDSFDDLDLDRALASGLSALAPDVGPAEASLVTMRPRFERARTRRRVVRAGTVAVMLLIIGSAAAIEAPSARRSHVRVASPPTTNSPTTTTAPKTSTTKKAVPATTVPRTVPAPKPSLGSAPRPTSGTGPVFVVPTPVPTMPPSTGPSPTRIPTPTTTVPHLTGVRYYSLGGSIVVRLSHGRMTLLGVHPLDGYRGAVHVNHPLKIDVWFNKNGHMASRIELIVVDGKVMRIPHSSWNSGDSDGSHHWSHVSASSTSSHVQVRSGADSDSSHSSSSDSGGNAANAAVTNSDTTSDSATSVASDAAGS